MPDPISTVLITVVATKFVDKAWEKGEKWLTKYFESHGEKAQEKAQANAGNFLNEVANQIKEKENQGKIDPQAADAVQDEPEFSSMLQKALLAAAETSNPEKHKLLARLITERMQNNSETLLSLASKRACELIPYISSRQLYLLGFTSNLLHISPSPTLSHQQAYHSWLVENLAPYFDHNTLSEVTTLDLQHLQSLGCLSVLGMIRRDLTDILANKNNKVFDSSIFNESILGKKTLRLWEGNQFQTINLTAIGQLLGIYTNDLIVGTSTDISSWGQ